MATDKAKKYRLCIFRSNKNIFAQIIDSEINQTLVSASSLKLENGGNVSAAVKVGTELAEKAVKENIVNIVFDRNGFQYKGRVKAFAEAAREAGLKF